MDAVIQTTSNLPDWITAVATVSGILVAGVALNFQLKKATEANQIHTAAVQAGVMLKYEDMFRDEDMLEERVALSRFLLENMDVPVTRDNAESWDVASETLDFFQGLATFTRKQSLDIETVHKNFFYWLSFYYPACVGYIRFEQGGRKGPESTVTGEQIKVVPRPLYLADLDWLFGELSRLEKTHNAGAYLLHSDEDKREFFEWEIELSTKRLLKKRER